MLYEFTGILFSDITALIALLGLWTFYWWIILGLM